jgi:hypothetical protein
MLDASSNSKMSNPTLGSYKPCKQQQLFWNQDKSGYSCHLPKQLLTNLC